MKTKYFGIRNFYFYKVVGKSVYVSYPYDTTWEKPCEYSAECWFKQMARKNPFNPKPFSIKRLIECGMKP